MTSDELSALRALIREEINAATYASEQRLGERIDQVEQRLGGRLDRVEERMGNLETTVSSMGEQMGNLETTVASMGEQMDSLETTLVERMDRIEERLVRDEFVQKQMMVNLAQVGSVLDEATIKINDLQRSQIALETKVEENTASIKRDIQKLNYSVRSFMDNMVDAVSGITMRFSMHKDTPINDAHPLPQHKSSYWE